MDPKTSQAVDRLARCRSCGVSGVVGAAYVVLTTVNGVWSAWKNAVGQDEEPRCAFAE